MDDSSSNSVTFFRAISKYAIVILELMTEFKPYSDCYHSGRCHRSTDTCVAHCSLVQSFYWYVCCWLQSGAIVLLIHMLLIAVWSVRRHRHSHHPSLLHFFTPGTKPTYSTNPSHLNFSSLLIGLPSWSWDWTGLIMLISLFLVLSFIFCVRTVW